MITLLGFNDAPLDSMLDLLQTMGVKDVRLLRDHVSRLREYRDGLFSLSPFEEGERVALAPRYLFDTTDSPGLAHYKDCLAPGATGTVRRLDWREGTFVVLVDMDEVWEYHEGKKIEIDKGYSKVFPFKPDDLRLV